MTGRGGRNRMCRWGNGPRSAFQASRACYGAFGWRASRGLPGRRTGARYPYGGVHMDKDQFLIAALQNPANEIIAEELFRLALPDAWLVSGCLVQTVWNVLTSCAVDYGINDYDVSYFDPDASWEAEDKIIRTLAEQLASRGIQVEARNQARVHLWYPEKHRLPYPELRCSTEGIDRFLTRNTQIGIRRTQEDYEV